MTFGIAAIKSDQIQDALLLLYAACDVALPTCVELSVVLKDLGRTEDAKMVLESRPCVCGACMSLSVFVRSRE